MTEWKPIQDDNASSTEDESWTLSQVNEPGWSTDMGYNGYGIPYNVAKWICDRLNESNQKCPYEQDDDGCWI